MCILWKVIFLSKETNGFAAATCTYLRWHSAGWVQADEVSEARSPILYSPRYDDASVQLKPCLELACPACGPRGLQQWWWC